MKVSPNLIVPCCDAVSCGTTKACRVEEAAAVPRGLAGVTLEPWPTGKYEVSPPRCCKTPGCDGRLWCVLAIFGVCRCHNATRHEQLASQRANCRLRRSRDSEPRPPGACAGTGAAADGRPCLSRACWPCDTMNCPQHGKLQDRLGGACLVGVRMSVIVAAALV
jgi:hypothetical protein